jgi:hypothetical protein
LFLLLLVVRVVIFTMITVVAMDMWRHFATEEERAEGSGSPFFIGYWWYWFCRI